MKSYKNNISSVEERIREVYEIQRIVEPCVCECSAKYKKAKELWEQKAEGLEVEIRRLQRSLNRTLNRGFKPRTDGYSLHHNR